MARFGVATVLTCRFSDAFKVQSHLIFFDTTHNSRLAALANLYGALEDTATKMWAYARCLPKEKRPALEVFTGMDSRLVGTQ